MTLDGSILRIRRRCDSETLAALSAAIHWQESLSGTLLAGPPPPVFPLLPANEGNISPSPPFAVACWRGHRPDKRRREPFRGSCSLQGDALSYYFQEENAESLTLPQNPLNILLSVS